MTDCKPAAAAAAGLSSDGQNFFIHICVVHHRTKGTWCCVAFTHSSNNNNNCYSYEQIAKPIQANELKLLLGLTLTHTHANALLDAVTRCTQLSIANAFYALFREFLGGGVTTKRGFSPEKLKNIFLYFVLSPLFTNNALLVMQQQYVRNLVDFKREVVKLTLIWVEVKIFLQLF